MAFQVVHEYQISFTLLAGVHPTLIPLLQRLRSFHIKALQILAPVRSYPLRQLKPILDRVVRPLTTQDWHSVSRIPDHSNSHTRQLLQVRERTNIVRMSQCNTLSFLT